MSHRETGTSPRQLGVSPRQLGTNPRALLVERKRLYKALWRIMIIVEDGDRKDACDLLDEIAVIANDVLDTDATS